MHVYGREISVADIGFSNSLLKIKEDLELLLDIFNKSRICNGSISANEMTAYKTYFGKQYVETCGKWFHEKCLKVLPEDNR